MMSTREHLNIEYPTLVSSFSSSVTFTGNFLFIFVILLNKFTTPNFHVVKRQFLVNTKDVNGDICNYTNNKHRK